MRSNKIWGSALLALTLGAVACSTSGEDNGSGGNGGEGADSRGATSSSNAEAIDALESRIAELESLLEQAQETEAEIVK